MNPLRDALAKKKQGFTISIELGPDSEKKEMNDEHEMDNKDLGIAPDLHDDKSKVVDQMNNDNEMDSGNDESMHGDPMKMSDEDKMKMLAEDAKGIMDSKDEDNVERRIVNGDKPSGLNDRAQFQAFAAKRGKKY